MKGYPQITQKQSVKSVDGLIVMDSIIKDIRYGVRGLLKHPGFTAIVVITLALGIGASTAIFSVVDNVLLRRLPYRNANRVVAIEEMNREGKLGQVTSPNLRDWRAQNTVFEQLAAIKTTTSNLALQDHAERIDLAQTNANFFDVLGVTPQYGRLFIPEDAQARTVAAAGATRPRVVPWSGRHANTPHGLPRCHRALETRCLAAAGRGGNGNDHGAFATAVSRHDQHSFLSRRFTSATSHRRHQ